VSLGSKALKSHARYHRGIKQVISGTTLAWSCLLMSHVAWNMGGSRYPKWMVYSGKSDKMDDIEKQIKKSGSKYL
jgi:hypothetical protein